LPQVPIIKVKRMLFFLFFTLVPLVFSCEFPEKPSKKAEIPPWTGKAFNQGVVALSHPLAAEIGARILKHGGNALDAAAAIQFALNVVEPEFSGIGGSCFIMIFLSKTGETLIIDSREKAPAAATPDMFKDLDYTEASTSGLSIGIPGTLLGFATALKKYGTISLVEALQPAVELARDGFHINRFLAANTNDPRTAYQPETKAVFRLPDGSPLPEGYLLKQPDLAKTFELISEHGPEFFYHGEIAQAVVEAQKRTRTTDPSRGVGRMTREDLARYNVKIRHPVVCEYRGYTIKSMSPPSAGGLTLLQMLKILERFPLGDSSAGFGFGAKKTLHVMIEAMRLAFTDRALWMGDEDFVPVPKSGLLANQYIAMRSSMIHENKRMTHASPGNPWQYQYQSACLSHKLMSMALPERSEGGHTTHFSVVDKWGNIVSCTSTIEAVWGTGIMVPGYGFLLNNDLTDFNLTPQYNPATGNPGANDIAAFKRPQSSMTPTIIFKDGKPMAAYGSPGGAGIINSVLQITLNLIDHGMTIQQAIDAPRISVTSAKDSVFREVGFSEAVILGLRNLGHPVSSTASRIGSVQAVVVDLQNGQLFGGADGRREGTVIGLPGDGKALN
jgi:gamma-glutamyltranspeptidase/glutathione hydrolase